MLGSSKTVDMMDILSPVGHLFFVCCVLAPMTCKGLHFRDWVSFMGGWQGTGRLAWERVVGEGDVAVGRCRGKGDKVGQVWARGIEANGCLVPTGHTLGEDMSLSHSLCSSYVIDKSQIFLRVNYKLNK